MRPLLFLVLCVIAYVCPWWILGVAGVVYAIRFNAIELIALGMALDMLYGVASGYFGVPLVSTVAAIGVVLLMSYIRPLFHTYRR